MSFDSTFTPTDAQNLTVFTKLFVEAVIIKNNVAVKPKTVIPAIPSTVHSRVKSVVLSSMLPISNSVAHSLKPILIMFYCVLFKQFYLALQATPKTDIRNKPENCLHNLMEQAVLYRSHTNS